MHLPQLVSDPDLIRKADKVVLPGVGAFKDCIDSLRNSGLTEPVLDHIQSGKPFMGICVGLQMLFDFGYEDGEHAGLGVLKGKCVRFDVDRGDGPEGAAHGVESVDGAKAFTAV